MASYLINGECIDESLVSSVWLPLPFSGDPLAVYMDQESPVIDDLGWAIFLRQPYDVYDADFNSLFHGQTYRQIWACDPAQYVDYTFQILAVAALFFACAAGYMKGGQR